MDNKLISHSCTGESSGVVHCFTMSNDGEPKCIVVGFETRDVVTVA